MSNPIDRRDLLTSLGGLGALLVASTACAQQKPVQDPQAPAGHAGHAGHVGHAGHGAKDPAPAGPASKELLAVMDATADCARAGRWCLARCTDHLAAGSPMMEHCQRAVMNMLAVVAAMGDVAGYRNAVPQNMKALATTCAAFCRACADACQPHSSHHEECLACMNACLACAKACEAFAAA